MTDISRMVRRSESKAVDGSTKARFDANLDELSQVLVSLCVRACAYVVFVTIPQRHVRSTRALQTLTHFLSLTQQAYYTCEGLTQMPVPLVYTVRNPRAEQG